MPQLVHIWVSTWFKCLVIDFWWPLLILYSKDERSDFEMLWFTLLSMCQTLPWDVKEPISENEELFLKMGNLPKNLASTYPELAHCFSPLLCWRWGEANCHTELKGGVHKVDPSSRRTLDPHPEHSGNSLEPLWIRIWIPLVTNYCRNSSFLTQTSSLYSVYYFTWWCQWTTLQDESSFDPKQLWTVHSRKMLTNSSSYWWTPRSVFQTMNWMKKYQLKAWRFPFMMARLP